MVRECTEGLRAVHRHHWRRKWRLLGDCATSVAPELTNGAAQFLFEVLVFVPERRGTEQEIGERGSKVSAAIGKRSLRAVDGAVRAGEDRRHLQDRAPVGFMDGSITKSSIYAPPLPRRRPESRISTAFRRLNARTLKMPRIAPGGKRTGTSRDPIRLPSTRSIRAITANGWRGLQDTS